MGSNMPQNKTILIHNLFLRVLAPMSPDCVCCIIRSDYDTALTSIETNRGTIPFESNRLPLRKENRKGYTFGASPSMSLVTIFVLVVLVPNNVQLVDSFLWTPSWIKQLPRQLGSHVPPPTHSVLDQQVRRKRSSMKGCFPLHSLETIVEYQSDDKYDRGEMHISAAVNEGDTIVYRTGSWYVDGVLVGEEGAVPAYEFCRVETIQLVWTHNCEHGVLRGLAVDVDDGEEQMSLRTPLDDIQFGPEQIIARISNVVWEPNPHDEDSDAETGSCSIPLHSSIWKEYDENDDE